jgi:ComF family protein
MRVCGARDLRSPSARCAPPSAACGFTLSPSRARRERAARVRYGRRRPVPPGAPLRDLGRDLLELLLPFRCAGCRRSVPRGATLCAACDREIPRIGAATCALCQEAAAAAGGRCAACALAASALDACCAAAWFEGAAASWVKRFKYAAPGLAGLDPAAEAVALALVREAAGRVPGPPPDAVVPVPLHTARMRRRGYAPAGILAAAVARALAVPLVPGALLRLRDTPSQTGLSRAERRRNVAGCFRAISDAGAPDCIWLVDDVVTTGATLGEGARALRRAGARRIAALCLARTPAPPR